MEDKELEEIKKKKMKELIRKMEYPKEPVEVTDSTFKDFVKKYPVVIVDCWASWCGPCLILAPIIKSLAKKFAGKIVFGKLNVDKNPKIPQEYGIMSIPTLLVFKNGKLVDRIIGAMPEPILEERLSKYL